MQLEKLQIDLRPRPNAQALDLGFALVRAHARDVYLAWWALWLPLMALCGGLAYLFPETGSASILLAWWLKPLLERSTLYILSRYVFGEEVSWKDALRAWPRQLGGGMWRMLTWWRPFAAGRSLYQPIWQLEGARGKAAAERRKVLAKNGTARSAIWFGVACAHFEGILQLGLLGFIGIFMSDNKTVSPFAYLFNRGEGPDASLIVILTYICYAVGAGLIGPIYSACGFTLYLNRRATLEAWDIEIVLRQITPPARKPVGSGLAALMLAPMLAVLGALALTQPDAAMASTPKSVQAMTDDARCKKPDWVKDEEARRSPDYLRSPDHSEAQGQLRAEVDELFASDDFRTYICKESWQRKNAADKKEPPKKEDKPDLATAAEIIKVLLIAAAIGLAGWLLYRYRGHFPDWFRPLRPAPATEIGGLDIRPESLPADVTASVLAFWERGERRAALALLYRATLSRLVEQDRLPLTQGATEGDCLRIAAQAQARQQLGTGRFDALTTAGTFWLNGAYGARWPDGEAVRAACAEWQAQFDAPAAKEAT